MTSALTLDSLSNALATPAQLSSSSSSLDGIPSDLESSIRFAGALLTQAAGLLLRLPQDVITQAIVIFTRFWIGPDGGSFAIHSAKVSLRNCQLLNQGLTFTGRICSFPLSDSQAILPSHITSLRSQHLQLPLIETSVTFMVRQSLRRGRQTETRDLLPCRRRLSIPAHGASQNRDDNTSYAWL